MRDQTLHGILEGFALDAAARLHAETADGVEVPFEVVEADGRPGRAPLYCYRPLTEEFIAERVDLLRGLATYAPAAEALSGLDRSAAYLVTRGAPVPPKPWARAEAALHAFLRSVFAERSGFEFEPERFETAYAELERALYAGRSLITVIAPLLGIALDGQAELALAEGLSLVSGAALPGAPAEAVPADDRVLVKLTATEDPMKAAPMSLARTRFRRVLTTLRLFERGGYALGPLAWMRVDTGPWRPTPFAVGGRPRLPVVIGPDQADELRAFFNLVERQMPCDGRLAWALARFEMGSERLVPFEALTDYLLALRALLEPDRPEPRRLAQRVAAICAAEEDRGAVAQRLLGAIALERALIQGADLAEPDPDELVDEVCEHLSALLCDVLCGHLEGDLVALADDVLADGAAGDDADEHAVAFPVAAPYSVPAGTGSVMPTRHDM